MRKSFYEVLAEQDEEFTYYVKSTYDIQQPEYFERVKHALLPWRIKEIKPDGHTPYSRDNKTFPDWPNTATFSIKVVTGLPIDTKKTLETVAMVCHIHISHLKMLPEDDVQSELVGKPVEVDKTTAQLLVGSKRIGEFMHELKKDRAEREKKGITREVYESFFTTHLALENLLKKPIRNGYYMVEMSHEGTDTYMRAEGPYEARTDGNPYRDSIGVAGAKIVSEDASGALYGVQALVELKKKISVGQTFEVRVSDMNSGRRFTSMVHAMTPELARQMAVQQVAETNRLNPTDLTAMAPRASGEVAEASRPPTFNTAAMTQPQRAEFNQAAQPIVDRRVQAYHNFVNQIMERGGFDEPTAQAMMKVMMKEKMVKYDGSYRYMVKHGAMMEPDVLQRIAHYATTGEMPQ